MNVQIEHNRMQVDTGPVIFPDFSQSVDREIKRLNFAFVCYNNLSVAEFILRQPMKSQREDKGGSLMLEYSDVRRLEVKNEVICAGEP